MSETTAPLGGQLDAAPPAPARPTRQRTTPLGALGLVIGAMFAVPAAFVVFRTVRLDAPLGSTIGEVAAPLWRTVQLAVLVSLSAAFVGTLLAWVTVRTDLPLRRAWRVALVLPLVLPSFVGAGAFIAGLAPGGVLHDALDAVGITPPRRFRGLGASWFVLTAFTYPYVLLPVSARLGSLPASREEGARMLGFGPRQAFLRVTLPEIRPAIVAGGLLVFLYTLSEFGAVQLLGYDTLTRIIFTTRQADRAVSFASAVALLLLAVMVVALERRFRGRSRPDVGSISYPHRPTELGWRKVPATITCLAALGAGLIAPVLSLAGWARRGIASASIDYGDLLTPTINTATVSVLAAVITVVVVLPIAIESTRRPSLTTSIAAGSVLGGFAIPGLVIALALAVLTLNTPGIGWLYQSLAVLIAGYVIHFGSQALASTEQAVRAVPERVREQARLLEPNAWTRAARVDLPLMRPGLVTGAGLVMLATVKELPATLLLAPTDFSTLATEIWGGFDEGFYAETGVTSLLLIVVSAALTWLLVLRPSTRR